MRRKVYYAKKGFPCYKKFTLLRKIYYANINSVTDM